jgi:hypothetical protein
MRGRRIAAYTAVAVFTSLLGWSSASPALATTTYAGRATALAATVSGVPITRADTGELPGSGGSLDATEPTAGVPDTASADTLHASTIGVGNFTHSESSAGGVEVEAGVYSISADLVMSRANADNQGGWVILGARSHVDGLLLNGLPVVVTGDPNQVVPLVGGQLVLNEQTSSTTGLMKTITVTALHLTVGDVDVKVGTSKAGLTQAAQACSPTADFATGGGWLAPSGVQKRTFGFVGGVKDGTIFRGHFTYHNRVTGDRIQGQIVSYQPVPGNSRTMQGEGELNGDDVTFELMVTDNGEPGSGSSTPDELTVIYPGGFDNAPLGGGNIKLHPGC